MSNKRLMLIAIFTVGLLAISAVNAQDNATSDVIGMDEVNEVGDIFKETNSDNLNESLSFGNLTTYLGNVSGPDVYLDYDYVYIGPEYYEGEDGLSNVLVDERGIFINNALIIHGNGHIIDAAGAARIFNVGAGDVVLKDIVFVNGYSDDDFSPIYWNAANGVISNCSFVNFHAQNGGAICWNGYDGAVLDCNFTDCLADNGGAIYWNSYGGTLTNCNFKDSYSNDVGGAICWNGVNGSLSGCNFTNCSAKGNGGAIKWNSINGTVDNCDFTSCASIDGSGSAVDWCGADGFLINSNFADCHAKGYGTIYWEAPDGSIANCIFDKCYSQDSAGAIFWNSNGGSVTGCNFTDCFSCRNSSTEDYAGVIMWYGANGSVINSNFVDCYANGGGGIYWNGFDGVITNCNFTNCTSVKSSGGAILWPGERGILSNSNFLNCSCNRNGGAVNGMSLAGLISNCSFVGCCADCGGAIYGGHAKDCTFNDNKANEGSNCYNTSAPKLDLRASNFNSHYASGESLFINATDSEGRPVNNVVVTIRVYKNEKLIGTYDSFTNTEWLVELDAGKYTANMTVEHDSYELVKPATLTLTIDKMPTNIVAASFSTVYNGGKYLVATLKDSKGNEISGVNVNIKITKDKKATLTTDKNGQVRLSANGLAPVKTYAATIAFAGNSNYAKCVKSVKVAVKKATPKLTAKSKAFKRSDKAKKYRISLKTNRNKAMKNTIVFLKVAGKLYSAKTNGKGVATFKLTKLTKKGKYNAFVKCSATKYYNAKSLKVKISVK